jgi:hypothetical protein
MVRPGISIYGIDPTCRPSVDRPLRPVMRWIAPLIAIRDVAPGRRWDTARHGRRRPTRLGLIPIGYADGYPRLLSNCGTMMVAGQPAPVAGRVSMDLTVIDLQNAPHAMVGDDVTVLDDDPISPASVYRIAELAGTIPYEILCRIGSRVRRVAAEEPTDRGGEQRIAAKLEEDGLERLERPVDLKSAAGRLSPLTHEAEQEQKHIDEIEVEHQSAVDGKTRGHRGIALNGDGHRFQSLGVVSGQAGKDDDAGVGNDPVEGAAGDEDIDDGGDDQADQGHEQNFAHGGEIGFCDHSIDAHHAEHRGAGDERAGDAGQGVDEKDDWRRSGR